MGHEIALELLAEAGFIVRNWYEAQDMDAREYVISRSGFDRAHFIRIPMAVIRYGSIAETRRAIADALMTYTWRPGRLRPTRTTRSRRHA